MRKFHVTLLLLGSGFLGYLFWKIGVHELWHELVLLGWGMLPFIVFEFVAETIHTIAWSHCLSGPLRRLPWMRLFQIHMAGYAISYLTPTAAIGGEVSKIAFLSSSGSGPEAASGVLAGKLCNGVGQLLFVAFGSVFLIGSATLPHSVWVLMILSGGLVAAGMLVFLLLQKFGKLGAIVCWLAAQKFTGRKLHGVARQIGEVDEALKILHRERPQALARSVAWHMFAHATGILPTWCFFALLHQPVSIEMATTVWVLGLWFDLLAFAVPLNLGTLEGSRILAFKAIGSDAVTGMAFGIAQRLSQLFCACLGLGAYAWLTSHVGRPAPALQLPAPAYLPKTQAGIVTVNWRGNQATGGPSI